MAIYTSQFILLLLSVVTSSINTNETHAMHLVWQMTWNIWDHELFLLSFTCAQIYYFFHIFSHSCRSLLATSDVAFLFLSVTSSCHKTSVVPFGKVSFDCRLSQWYTVLKSAFVLKLLKLFSQRMMKFVNIHFSYLLWSWFWCEPLQCITSLSNVPDCWFGPFYSFGISRLVYLGLSA